MLQKCCFFCTILYLKFSNSNALPPYLATCGGFVYLFLAYAYQYTLLVLFYYYNAYFNFKSTALKQFSDQTRFIFSSNHPKRLAVSFLIEHRIDTEMFTHKHMSEKISCGEPDRRPFFIIVPTHTFTEEKVFRQC